MERLEYRQLLAGDLIGHWTADAEVEIADGSITGWNDLVSNVNATVMGNPTLIDNALRGRAAIQFDPTDGADEFRVLAADNALSGADDFSVAIVFATDSNNLEGPHPDWFRNSGSQCRNRSD